MFKGINNGFQLIKSAIQIFKKHPVLIVPLFIVWIVFASLLVYFKWDFPWANYNRTGQLIFAYLFFLFTTYLLTISCSVLLELIQQNELGDKMSFKRSLSETFGKNLAHIIVLSIAWSLIWFFLVILKVIFSKKRNDNDEEKSAENVARTLSGDSSFSWFGLSIDLIIKGVRMVVFLILPGVAWQELGIRKSIKKGFQVLSDRRSEFVGGFTLSLGTEFMLFLPAAIMFYLSGKGIVTFDDIAWYLCILYIGFAWSFSLYLEQMFAAELYLWQIKYEDDCRKARNEGRLQPKFEQTKRPHILDEVPDILELKRID